MNSSSTPFRCTAIILIYSLIGQAVLAGPLQQLPANTIGFVTWSEPVEKEQLKDLATWLNNVVDTLPAEQDDLSTQEAVHQAIELGRYLLSGAGVVGLMDLVTSDGERELYAVGSFNLGPFAPRVAQIVEQLGEYNETPLKRVTIAGRGYQQAEFNGGATKLLFATEEGYLTAVFGGENIEGVVSSLDQVDLSVADSKYLQLTEKKIGKLEDAQVAAYLDVQRLVATLKALSEAEGELPPELDLILDELGVSAIKSVAMRLHQDGKASQTRAYIATEGDRVGVLKFWDHQPLTQQDIALIPEDACYGMAFQFDGKMIYEELMRVLREIAPEGAGVVGSAMGVVQGMTNISLPNDLLPALGDTWILYETPDDGGMLVTGVTLIVDVKDKEALRGIFGRVIDVCTPLLEQANCKLQVMHVKESGKTIEYLVFGGLPIPVAPAACFVGDRVVVGLTPQVVKLALEQVSGKQPASSVLNHPDIKASIKALPKNAQSFYYTDTRSAVRSMYWLTHLFSTAAASMAPTEKMNPGMLPTLPEQLEMVTNGYSGWSTDDDGLLYTGEGQMSLAMSGAGGVWVTAVLISILLPSLARARELAKRAVSRANVRGIGQACYIYANDNDDKFPQTLDELIEAGALSPKQLVSPRQSSDVSYVYIPQSIDGDVRNILAYEKLIGDDGTVVLYLDGHADWVPEAVFREELAATGKRLERELEVVYGD